MPAAGAWYSGITTLACFGSCLRPAPVEDEHPGAALEFSLDHLQLIERRLVLTPTEAAAPAGTLLPGSLRPNWP